MTMNREPVRTGKWRTFDHRDNVSGAGTITEYPRTDTQAVTFVIKPTPDKDGRAVFLLDDGTSVQPAYTAGWTKDYTSVFVQPFPVNDGSIRPDNGREVDFTHWHLSPRRAFHLKVTWSE